jgi:very-short-patch-repair endonuclease
MTAREQRAALIASIRKSFPDAKVECSDLPWLSVPTTAGMDEPLKGIFSALCRHRGHNAFATAGRRLVCDIVIPSKRLIVEYDERQHFTKPRAIALRLYPQATAIGFDAAEWIAHCDRIAAIDNDPPYRDEQRAFYDSVRDILAAANGYRVVRLKHGAFDWGKPNAREEILRKLSVRPTATEFQRPRFATVCIEGQPAQQYRTHTTRLALLKAIVCKIDQRWEKLEAVAFPGGFLRLDRTIGELPYDERVEALHTAGFVDPIKSAMKRLTRSPASVLVFGVDGPTYPNGNGGDQLCVAANRTGIIGISRKIFPTQAESDGLLCFDADFHDPHRVVELAGGRNATLSACYDMFGVAERGDLNGTRARYIRRIGVYEDQLERRTEGFNTRLVDDLAPFERVLANQNVTVGIAAIHYFHAHNTAFWQRHGIAPCSAALGSGFAIGAAHFKELPRNPNSSTLAAAGVPPHALADRRYRQAHSWTPACHFPFNSEDGSALVRLFC